MPVYEKGLTWILYKEYLNVNSIKIQNKLDYT